MLERKRGKMATFDSKVDFLSPKVSGVNPFGSSRMSGGANGGEKTVSGIDFDSDYANGRGGRGSEVPGCGPNGESVFKELYA